MGRTVNEVMVELCFMKLEAHLCLIESKGIDNASVHIIVETEREYQKLVNLKNQTK
jgi:hypothetical protein